MEYYTQNGFNTEQIKRDIKFEYSNIDIDISRFDDPYKISASLKAYMSDDQKEVTKDSDISYIVIPNGIISTILTRMFGEGGVDIPKFLPEWAKSKLRPKVKIVKTSFEFNSTIQFRRMCPHISNESFSVHDNFVRYGDFSSSENDTFKNIKEIVEYDCYGELSNQIIKLSNKLTQISGVYPTNLSLGIKEVKLIEQDPSLRMYNTSDLEHFSFLGMKIECIDRPTYLALY